MIAGIGQISDIHLPNEATSGMGQAAQRLGQAAEQCPLSGCGNCDQVPHDALHDVASGILHGLEGAGIAHGVGAGILHGLEGAFGWHPGDTAGNPLMGINPGGPMIPIEVPDGSEPLAPGGEPTLPGGIIGPQALAALGNLKGIDPNDFSNLLGI